MFRLRLISIARDLPGTVEHELTPAVTEGLFFYRRHAAPSVKVRQNLLTLASRNIQPSRYYTKEATTVQPPIGVSGFRELIETKDNELSHMKKLKDDSLQIRPHNKFGAGILNGSMYDASMFGDIWEWLSTFSTNHPYIASILISIGTSIASVSTILRLYQLNRNYEKQITNRFIKLNELLFRAEKLKSDIQECYHEAYTSIQKEDRMKVSQLKRLERDSKLVISELEDFIVELEAHFNKMKTRRRFGMDLAKSCNEKIKQAKFKKFQVESYFYIAKSVFHCQIKNYNDAVISIKKAFDKYFEAIVIDNPDMEKYKKNFENVNKLFSKMMHLREVDFYTYPEGYAIDFVHSILQEITIDVASLYRPSYKDWYSDILLYFGYVIYDSFSKDEQFGELSLLPAFFWVIAAKINPYNHIAYSNIGFIYAKLGNLNEAKSYMERSIAMDDLFPLSRFNLGMLLLLSEKREEAKTVLNYSAKIIAPHFNPNDGKHEEKIDGGVSLANIDLLNKIQKILRDYNHEDNDFYRKNKPVVSVSKLDDFGRQSIECAQEANIAWLWNNMKYEKTLYGKYGYKEYPVKIETNEIGIACFEYHRRKLKLIPTSERVLVPERVIVVK